MKKFLLPGILAVFFLFLPLRSQANPLDVPTRGNQISPPFSATASGFFDFVSTFTVTLTTPPVNGMWCVDKLVVTAPSAGMFSVTYASTTANNSPTNTTIFGVWLAAATPYNSELDYREPLCAPANQLMTFSEGVAGSTFSVEGYSFTGWNP
jgi:hypothetical protein